MMKKRRLLIHIVLLAACSEASLSEKELAALDASMMEVAQWQGTELYAHPENPFLKEIPEDYVIHENSAEMIELIKSQAGPNLDNTSLSVGDYAIPDVYFAEVCVISHACRNRRELFRLDVGTLFECDFDERAFLELRTLLRGSG